MGIHTIHIHMSIYYINKYVFVHISSYTYVTSSYTRKRETHTYYTYIYVNILYQYIRICTHIYTHIHIYMSIYYINIYGYVHTYTHYTHIYQRKKHAQRIESVGQ